MNSINIIYLIIPFILFSLHWVIVTRFSRMHWSLSMSFYRQFTIFLIGLPLLYFFPINFELLKENIIPIITTSIVWAWYLFIIFKSYDYIPVAIWNVFGLTSRILIVIAIGIFLLSESINLHQSIAIIVLFIGISLLFRLKEAITLNGILLSIISGAIWALAWYYFIQYSENFHPLIAWYILETFNWIFLWILLIGKSLVKKQKLNKAFFTNKQAFLTLILSAPLILIATWMVAKSYDVYSFTVVNIVLTLWLPASLIFSWFILKEKLSLKTVVAIIIITLSIVAIKFFEN